MWKIKNISASNFMSFDSLQFTFDCKCYIVKATNKDNDGQQSNGGGKTSFVDLVAIAILGTSLTGRSLKDCVRWDSDSTSFTVRLSMINEAHSLTCEIERTLFNNTKGQELSILVNDKVPKSIPTKKGVDNGVDVKAGDRYILEELLDITKQDLFSHYFISPLYYDPFLKIGTDKKLEVISRFSNATVVDNVIAKLKVENKANQELIYALNQDISKAKGYVEALNNSLNNDAKKEFEESKSRRILAKKNHISEIEQKLTDLIAEFEATESGKDSIGEIEDEQVERKGELKEEITLSENILSELYVEKRKLSKDISSIEKYEADLITCPKCEHEFTLSNDSKWKKGDLDKKTNDLTLVEESIELTLAEIETKKSELSELEKIARKNKETEASLKNLLKEQQYISDQSERLEKDIESVTNEIEKIKSEKFEDTSSDVKKKIGEKKKYLAKLENEDLPALEYDGADLLQWIDNFENFKFHLGNRPIEVICSLVNEQLKSLGSDLSLNIDGFKKLKSGEIRQALNPIVYRNWNNPKPYNQFSEGEKVRLNLAVDLAFQTLINNSSKHGGLDWYASDELMNSLDSLGVASVARSFDKLNKNIILVTHSGESIVYDNIIEIEKENGISKIKA